VLIFHSFLLNSIGNFPHRAQTYRDLPVAQAVGGLCGATRTVRLDEILEDRMKFRPLHDRVLVRRLEEEEKTAGGIIIPDTAKEKPMEGEIVAVGSGNRDENGKLQPLDVAKGDRVLFGKWSGTEVKIDGEELLIMKEADILGLIEVKRAKRKAA
jgi:chaperonin GroES